MICFNSMIYRSTPEIIFGMRGTSRHTKERVGEVTRLNYLVYVQHKQS
jgi:hypothetical protein